MISGFIIKALWFQILNKEEERSNSLMDKYFKVISMPIEFKDLENIMLWMEHLFKASGDNPN